MSDDTHEWIDRAARALRDEQGGRSDAAAQTRARILATSTRARQRPRWVMAAAAALVLALGIPVARAWTTGRLPRWLGDTPTEPLPPPRETAPARPPARVLTVAPMAPLAPLSPPPSPSPAPRAVAAAQPSPAPSPPSVDPAERRAYREAHALHFDRRDATSALHAWDRYLAAYPRGRFAIEARYNRALCLVRMNRRAEAREALRPFAEGEHGAYREREARALMEALDP